MKVIIDLLYKVSSLRYQLIIKTNFSWQTCDWWWSRGEGYDLFRGNLLIKHKQAKYLADGDESIKLGAGGT